MARSRERHGGTKARVGGSSYPPSLKGRSSLQGAPDFSRTYQREQVTTVVTRHVAVLQVAEVSLRMVLENTRGFVFHDGWSCELCGSYGGGAARTMRRRAHTSRIVRRDLCAQCIGPEDESDFVSEAGV